MLNVVNDMCQLVSQLSAVKKKKQYYPILSKAIICIVLIFFLEKK